MDITALFNAGALLGSLGAIIALTLRRMHQPVRASSPVERIDAIDALLPQTQCGYCGHAGCRPYAQAIAEGEAINRCPPGGVDTIAALANLLDLKPLPLDGEPRPKTVAFIREEECIGCTKCIQACPVDAILGAAKHMHTVLVDECTGCDLCVEPCPVDCIEMRPLTREPATTPTADDSALDCIRCGWCEPACPVSLQPQLLYRFALDDNRDQLEAHGLGNCIECRACEIVCPSHIPLVDYFQNAKSSLRQASTARNEAERYKARFEARNLRLQRNAQEREERRQRPEQETATPARSKQEEIRAAIARAKAKKASSPHTPPTQH